MSYYEEARARATVLMSCGVGRHAELAKQIVGGIDPVLRSALLAYHTSSLPFDRQARELLDIERDVYSARLAEAHAAIAMREDRYILATRERDRVDEARVETAVEMPMTVKRLREILQEVENLGMAESTVHCFDEEGDLVTMSAWPVDLADAFLDSDGHFVISE